MISWARRFLVALLAMALLSAPCLSVLGPLGPSAAHAHPGDQAHDIPQLQHQQDRNHSRHGPTVHDHHAIHGGEPELTSGPAVDPAMHQAGCCRLCEGWITRTVRDDLLAHKSAPGWPGPGAAKSAFATIPATMEQPPPGWSGGPAAASQPLGCGRIPLFALTSRYRL